jgi:hypothetical protein
MGLVSNGIRILLDRRCPLEYRLVLTVVETPSYLAVASKLFDAEEREDIVTTVATGPECGAVMAGTGGFREVRVAREEGVRAAARASSTYGYIWRNDKFPVFLIAVFPKNEKENLTHAERNVLKKRADEIFNDYRR